ncbi:MAG: hypothetical protein GXY82_07590 [Methanospirillum sp.]|nr:hypothetical protein [Methanospirillum sp.]
MDKLVRERAREEIGRILESASFDVAPMDPPLDLSAIRGGECVLVLCSDDEADWSAFDQTVYRVRAGGSEVVCRKILFSTSDRVRAEHCVAWGLPALVDYAGRSACARVTGRELALDLSLPLPPVVLREPERDAGAGGIPHLPVRISGSEASMLARSDGAVRLRLIPFWCARYSSSGGTTYKNHTILFDDEGLLALNAINGEIEAVEELPVVRGGLPDGTEVMEALIPREDAGERVVEHVVRSLTKKVRIRQERRDAIFYEEKVFRPDPRSIRTDLSRVFVPVWQVTGGSIVEINAYSGETLSSPMDEGVEIL